MSSIDWLLPIQKCPFRLIHNERKLLQTNGNGDVRQVLAAIYGINTVKKMIPIHATTLDFKIKWILHYQKSQGPQETIFQR